LRFQSSKISEDGGCGREKVSIRTEIRHHQQNSTLSNPKTPLALVKFPQVTTLLFSAPEAPDGQGTSQVLWNLEMAPAF